MSSDDDDDVFVDAPEWLADLAAEAGVPHAVSLEITDLPVEMKKEIFARLRHVSDLGSVEQVSHEFRRLLLDAKQQQWLNASTLYVAELKTVGDWWSIDGKEPSGRFKYHDELCELTASVGWLRCLRQNFARRARCDPAAFVGELKWLDMGLEQHVLSVIEPVATNVAAFGTWEYEMSGTGTPATRDDRFYTHAAVACVTILLQSLNTEEFDAGLIVRIVDKWVAVDGAEFCTMMLFQQLEAMRAARVKRGGRIFSAPHVSTVAALNHLVCRHLLHLPAPYATNAIAENPNDIPSKLNQNPSYDYSWVPCPPPEWAFARSVTPVRFAAGIRTPLRARVFVGVNQFPPCVTGVFVAAVHERNRQ